MSKQMLDLQHRTLGRRSMLAGLAVAGTAFVAGCGANQNPMSNPSGSGSAGGSTTELVVGSANFSESQVLGAIYAQAIAAKGEQTSTRPNIGSREVYIKALEDGSIQVVPEYTGNLLTYLNPKATATSAAEVEKALKPLLAQHSLEMLDPSKAVDQDVYCVTQQFSKQNGVTSLADLKKVAPNSIVAGPTELQQRSYGPDGLKKVYGLNFKKFKPYDSPAVKLKDLLANKIQVADFFTTEAAIKENNLVELKDPKELILPQNVVPVIAKKIAGDTTAIDAMNAVQKIITTDDLVELNKQVDTEKKDAKDVAAAWLKSKGLA